MRKSDIDTQRNFYGRVHGKTLRPQQKTDLAELLPQYLLAGVSLDENPDRTPLSVQKPLWLEVGFGGGEHLMHVSGAHPDVHFIGCEPFVNGIAMLLGKLRAAPRANLQIYDADVRNLFDVLPDGSLGRCYLNYPDPWPKARHNRRRFVTPDYLGPLRRCLEPGAELRIATDIPDYVRQAHEVVPGQGFALSYESGTPWEGWTRTRYEAKAVREGRVPHYMIWTAV